MDKKTEVFRYKTGEVIKTPITKINAYDGIDVIKHMDVTNTYETGEITVKLNDNIIGMLQDLFEDSTERCDEFCC